MTAANTDISNHCRSTLPGFPKTDSMSTENATTRAAGLTFSSSQSDQSEGLENRNISHDTKDSQLTNKESGSSAASHTPKPKQDLRRAGMKRINNVAIAATITFIAIIIIAIVVSVLGAKGYLAPIAKAKIWVVIKNGLVNGYQGAQHFFVHTSVGRVVAGALLGAAYITICAVACVGLRALCTKKQSPRKVHSSPKTKRAKPISENTSPSALKTNMKKEHENISSSKDSKNRRNS